MPKKKIDREKFAELTKKLTVNELATHFGVTRFAIYKVKREFKAAVSNSVVIEKAGEIAEENLDTLAQLRKINTHANELLDLLIKWNRGDETALQILESQVKMVRTGSEKDGKVEYIKEYKFKDPRELMVKVMAEIRSQLDLQVKIYQTLFDTKAAAEFQGEVLTAIGEVEPDVRDKIIRNLQRKRAIRTAIQLP